jgi:Bacterial cell division membrane protein
MNSIAKIFRGDKAIWILFMFFCFVSLIEVYSASSTLTFRGHYWQPILRHAIFLLFGAGIVLFVHAVKPRYFSLLMIALPLSWIFLILVKLFGETVNGSQRFYEIAGISFQPSELAKICLIATVAFILSKRKENKGNDKSMKWIVGLSAFTCILIFFENFSTAVLLFAVIFMMMFVGQIPGKKLWLLSLAIGGAAFLFVAFIMLAPDSLVSKLPRGKTWEGRIENFFVASEKLDPETYKITDDNLQRSHSQIAIAYGGLVGRLPGNSIQRDVLPQAYSDFIYSIIIEEMGLIGGAIILFLYIILFIRAGQIAARCDKLFPKYLVIGSSLIIMLQAMSNMAVAVGILPITGQPLPLISRGGTSMLVTCVYIGIILSVSRYENPKGVRAERQIEKDIKLQEFRARSEELKTKS